jgi:hypothetical protein
VIRPAFAAALAALLLSACSSQGDGASSSDPYAGQDQQILAWRTDIEAKHPACATKVEGKGCQDFQVMCKAAQEIDAAETAKGVTAQFVAAMTFAGRNADGSTGKSGSSFAVFSKANDSWSREESKPVNMSSCAPL